MSGEIAQTNLELAAQLQRAGWSAEDRAGVERAYGLAAELVSGWYRPSGKPFVDHFVGTAGVVAAAGGRPVLVRAALLHNVAGSVFGHQRLADRRELEAAIGAEATDLVLAYPSMPWDADAVAAHIGRADRLAGRERDLVVLRLANEVDDRLDGGRPGTPVDGEVLVELATRLGEPVLADLLARAPAAPRASTADGPRFVPPRGYRRGPALAARDAVPWVRRQGRRIAHRLRRVSGGGR
jgi:hypothetical protein